jgi:hypothetical protein
MATQTSNTAAAQATKIPVLNFPDRDDFTKPLDATWYQKKA